MTKTICLMISIAFAVAGCAQKPRDNSKDKIDEINRKTQQDLDELTNALYAGGQPGKITVNGIVVKKSAERIALDERLTVFQDGGKGNRGVSHTLVSEKKKPLLRETLDGKKLLKLETLNSYINLGCQNLLPKDIDGLIEQSAKGPADSILLALNAKKIFICGEQIVPQSFVDISSDQLVMRDATLTIMASLGSLGISANKLFLEGKNTLKTSGSDMIINVLDAPSLEISVGSEIHGDGTLLIQSMGGNCVQKDEKK